MNKININYILMLISSGTYFRHIFFDIWGFSTGGLSPGITNQFHSSYKLKGGDKMDYEIEPVEEYGVEPVNFYFEKEINIFGFHIKIQLHR